MEGGDVTTSGYRGSVLGSVVFTEEEGTEGSDETVFPERTGTRDQPRENRGGGGGQIGQGLIQCTRTEGRPDPLGLPRGRGRAWG